MYAFHKMQGLGNDFVIFNDHLDFHHPSFDFSNLSKKVAQRRVNVGCDQVIFLQKNSSGHPSIRFFNGDGSEAENCGNGTRCAAKLYMNENSLETVTFTSLGGNLSCFKEADDKISVTSKKPTIVGDITLTPQDIFTQPGTHVNVGNPHLVILETVEDFLSYGSMLENHGAFPNKTNVGFASVMNRDHIKLQVWERGTGPTLACGSAACAAAVAAYSKGLCKAEVQITQPGGVLQISIQASTITQKGPADFVFKGELLF
jgi:diaminopimelate epimerase